VKQVLVKKLEYFDGLFMVIPAVVNQPILKMIFDKIGQDRTVAHASTLAVN
jgi:hypothetical protein